MKRRREVMAARQLRRARTYRRSGCERSRPGRRSNSKGHDPKVGSSGNYCLDFRCLSGKPGGAEGNRTPDLCSAIAALSHLSYGPGSDPWVAAGLETAAKPVNKHRREAGRTDRLRHQQPRRAGTLGRLTRRAIGKRRAHDGTHGPRAAALSVRADHGRLSEERGKSTMRCRKPPFLCCFCFPIVTNMRYPAACA